MVKFRALKSSERRYRFEYTGGLVGHFDASYAQLRAILGPPSYTVSWNDNRDGKVSTEWYLRGDDGSRLTIYDYKMTNHYSRKMPGIRTFRSLPTYTWHIGGRGNAPALCDFLIGRMLDTGLLGNANVAGREQPDCRP